MVNFSHEIKFYTIAFICFCCIIFILFSSRLTKINVNDHISSTKVLILYAYFEKNDLYKKTLQYFIDNSIKENDNIDYVFIIQGKNCSPVIPKYKNIQIINRPNDCYDFGAYGKALAILGGINIVYKYKAIFFINPSAIGPLLPKYWPEEIHWTEIFMKRLYKNNVHAVGTAVYCNKHFGPVLLGMAFVATPLAVRTAFEANVFSCKKDKGDAIDSGEYRFSSSVINKGMNIDSLLLKYGKIDFRKKKNWNCNNFQVPAWRNSYDGVNVNPLEVVFHKPLWDKHDGTYLSEIFLNETILYMNWTYLRKNSR